jgi:hypothetical protein
MIPIGLVVAVFAAGLVLLGLGLRGFLVNDHPHCAKCGFDLIGLCVAQIPCPECGASVAGPNTVRIGKKRRRTQLVIVGGLLATCALGIGLAQFAGVLTQARLNSLKPLWLLRADARSGNWQTTLGAVSELAARSGSGRLGTSDIDALAATLMVGIEAGRLPRDMFAQPLASLVSSNKLSDDARDRLIIWAIALQGDPAKPWSTDLGGMIEAEIAAHRVPADLISRYAQQICRPAFHFPGTGPFSQGQTIPLFLTLNWRGGLRPIYYSIHVDGAVTPNPEFPRQRLSIPTDQSWEPVGFVAAENGDRTKTVSGSLEIIFDPTGLIPGTGSIPTWKDALASPTAIAVSIPLRVTCQVADAGSNSPLRDQVASMFWCAGGSPFQYDGQDVEAGVGLWATPFNDPLSIDCALAWRYAGITTELGQVEIRDWATGGSVTPRQSTRIGGSSYSGARSVPLQLHLTLPVRTTGPATGTLVIRVQRVSQTRDAAPSEVIPFELELRDVEIRR